MTAEQQPNDDELVAAIREIDAALDESAREAWTSFVGAAIRGDTEAMRSALDLLAASRDERDPPKVLAASIGEFMRIASERAGASPEAFDVPLEELARLSREQLEGVVHKAALMAFARGSPEGPAH